VDQVIENIKRLRSKRKEAKEIKEKTLHYYVEQEERMFYKTYRDKGLLIGSCPIKAADRSVFQITDETFRTKVEHKGCKCNSQLEMLTQEHSVAYS
jgi:hypothetical protein